MAAPHDWEPVDNMSRERPGVSVGTYLRLSISSWNCGSASSISFSSAINA